MKRKTNIYLIIVITITVIIAGCFLYKKFYNPNPSEEEIQKGIEEKDKIRNELSNIIKGDETENSDYKIPIEEARQKAITIFNSLGEKNLNKENVSVIEIDRKEKKYYYISSAENNAEVEISTGKVTKINGVPTSVNGDVDK